MWLCINGPLAGMWIASPLRTWRDPDGIIYRAQDYYHPSWQGLVLTFWVTGTLPEKYVPEWAKAGKACEL